MRSHWGRGFGSEAAAAALDLGLRAPRLSRIIAIIDPHNGASIRIARKIGMRFEREIMFPEYAYPDHLYAVQAVTAR